VVLLPIRGWSAITRKALRFALKISHEVYDPHIVGEEDAVLDIEDAWTSRVREPTLAVGLPTPKLIVILSPLPPAARASERGHFGPPACPPRTRPRRDYPRAGRDAQVPLPLAQSYGGRDQGLPPVQRLPPRHGDQRPLVPQRLTANGTRAGRLGRNRCWTRSSTR